MMTRNARDHSTAQCVKIDALCGALGGESRSDPPCLTVVYYNLDQQMFDGDLDDSIERRTFARLRSALLQQRYRQSHLAKRAILAAYLRMPPPALRFLRHPRGKPYLANASLHFNLSHANGYFVIAICSNDVGIDCECVADEVDVAALAAVVAHPRETLCGIWAFYRTWARKEAVLKQLGDGLSRDPSSFAVPNTADRLTEWSRVTLETAPLRCRYVRDIAAPHQMVAAIALAQPMRVRLYELVA